jgi:hypothetical protein
MSHEICWELNGVVRRFWGNVSFSEVLRSVCEVQVDPRFNEMRYLMDDCLAVMDGCFVKELAAERLDFLQQLASSLSGSAHRAIVVDPMNAARVGERLGRTPQSFYRTRVFTTTDEARDWIAELAVEALPALLRREPTVGVRNGSAPPASSSASIPVGRFP